MSTIDYNEIELFKMNTRKEVKMAKKKKITPKEIRVNYLKITQEKLAKKLKITEGAVSNKETGKRSWSAKEILKLAKWANIDPSDIFLN